MAEVDAAQDAGLTTPLAPDPEPAPAAAAADEMSLVDHLAELRDRLIRVVIVVAIASCVGFFFSDQLISILKAPIPGNKPLFFTGLGDAFVIKLKISVVVGVILAMPVILWQVWGFVAPGLTPGERRIVRPWLPARSSRT
jgi:sec-independent protein translocase protein TatC